MVKEVLIVVGGVAAGAVLVYAVIALARKIMSNKEQGIEPERIYESELTINVIKEWFSEKIDDESVVGVIFYPTEENIKKYRIDVEVNENMIIQLVYDSKQDVVKCYREIAFGKLSDKLSKLMEENGGTLVIEK